VDVTKRRRSLTPSDTGAIISGSLRHSSAPPLGASLVRQGRPLSFNRGETDSRPSHGRNEFDRVHPTLRRASRAAVAFATGNLCRHSGPRRARLRSACGAPLDDATACGRRSSRVRGWAASRSEHCEQTKRPTRRSRGALMRPRAPRTERCRPPPPSWDQLDPYAQLHAGVATATAHTTAAKTHTA
jgi:hypothetical protein